MMTREIHGNKKIKTVTTAHTCNLSEHQTLAKRKMMAKLKEEAANANFSGCTKKVFDEISLR